MKKKIVLCFWFCSGGGGDDIEYEMGDMDLEQYDDYEEGEEEYNEEMQPDEEAGAAPTSDDADVCFKKHSGCRKI